jgi:hypothetical protein
MRTTARLDEPDVLATDAGLDRQGRALLDARAGNVVVASAGKRS